MEIDRETCPDPEVLAAWIDSGLAVADRAPIEAHLAGCEECRSLVALVLETQDALVTPVPAPASGRALLGWLTGVAVVATAALLVYGLLPARSRRVAGHEASHLADLVDAVADERTVGARLTSGVRQDPLHTPERSGGSSAAADDSPLWAAAGKIRKNLS